MIKKKKRLNYKMFYLITGLTFVIILILVLIINQITPVRSFSDKENRVLSDRPNLSLSHLLSGQFMEKLETYVNDQFVFRDFFVTLKASTDRVLGKVEEEGVFLGKKSHLIEDFQPGEDDAIQTTTDAMIAFREKYPDVNQYAMIVPTAVSVQADYLPFKAPVKDQNQYLDQLKKSLTEADITFVDVRDTLKKHKSEELYYHTDHHWTTQAAYYSFLDLGKEMLLDTEKYEYEKAPVSYEFQGTLSAKSGFLSGKKEELDVFLPTSDDVPGSVVNYVDEQTKSASFYDTSKLKTRDKYAMFFSGNHSEVKISTAVDNDKTLLILKDSYANCLVPFLAPYYQNIIMIDPRYYYGDLNQLMESEEITSVLYLYNANTFFSDTSLNITLTPGNH